MSKRFISKEEIDASVERMKAKFIAEGGTAEEFEKRDREIEETFTKIASDYGMSNKQFFDKVLNAVP